MARRWVERWRYPCLPGVIATILLDPQVLPFVIYLRFGFFVHQDFVWPWTGEAFGWPFARGVNAHLGAEIR
jgi:hypothetical protein